MNIYKIFIILLFTVFGYSQEQIEGKWIPSSFGNTMYEFVDGLRHTYYCNDYNNECDTDYWNSLDTSDAIPNPNPYWVNGNTLTIDLFFGNEATYTMGFRCDGQVVDFYYDEDDWAEGLHSTMFRLDFDDFDDDCVNMPEECFDLSGIDFGDCDMVLGIGWDGYQCEYFSGCDWIVDDIDYSDYFFDSWQGCEEICSSNNGCNLTTDDILGPYYFEDTPYRNVLAQEEEPGERLFISGLVKQNNCEFPISGSLIEIWHANDEGCYGIVEDCDTGNPEDDYFNLRGKFFSDENGNYAFESILPGYYASRPRHIHIKITTPSEEILVSQLYFEDDPLCESDPWCQDADGRIISLEENEFGLYGEINIIMDSSESGIILGDINFDTLLNIQDIVLLVGIIIGNVNPNDFQIYAGDINIDYIINVLDILQLTNIILNN